MFQAIVVLLSPFIQLGSSYYSSIATLAAAIGLLAWWRPLSAGLARSGFPVLIVGFMTLSYFSSLLIAGKGDFLRVGREGIIFLVLIAALIGFQRKTAVISRPPYYLFFIFAVFYFLLTVVQAYNLQRGIYVGLPQQWFATDAQTLASDLDLTYNAFLRPTGTFSEPSYLGFMMVSIALMMVPIIGHDRIAVATLALVILTGILSRSLAFYLSMIVVLLLPFALEKGANRVMILSFLLIFTVPVIALSGESVLSRVASAGSASTADMSTSDRVFGPLAALPGYLRAYPLGNPFSVVPQSLLPFLSRRTADPIDILNNAFFNLLFSYGIVGLVMIAIIVGYARDIRIKLYLITAAMFNGAFLAIDKIVVICLTLAIYDYGVNWSRSLVSAPPIPADEQMPSESMPKG